MEGRNLTRRQIFEIWCEAPGNRRTKTQYVQNRVLQIYPSNSDSNKIVIDKRKHIISRICAVIRSKWQKCRRHKDSFLIKNSGWLNKEVNFSDEPLEEPSSTSQINCSTTTDCQQFSRGKPKRSESSEKKIYCRLCLKHTSNTSFKSLDINDFSYPEKSVTFKKEQLEKLQNIAKMLKSYLPSSDSLSFDPIICDTCLQRLRISYELIKEWLKNQHHIDLYINVYTPDDRMHNTIHMFTI